MVLSSLYQLHWPLEKSTKQVAGVSRVDMLDGWTINPKSFKKNQKTVTVHTDTVQFLCQLAKLIWIAHAGIIEMSYIILAAQRKVKKTQQN